MIAMLLSFACACILVFPFSQSHCYTLTLLGGWYVRYVKEMTRGPLRVMTFERANDLLKNNL